jgi:hypothetical protein
MIPDLEPASRFLETLAASVARMDDWGYSLALRFHAYDRSHGVARMFRGGRLSVACGFRVAREPARELIFAIVFNRQPDQWLLTVEVEDEDEYQSRFHWESPAITASSPPGLDSAIDEAFAVLDRSLQFPEVSAALEMIHARQNGFPQE